MKAEEKFQQLYQSLNRNNVSYDRLAECYSQNIEFSDPFHRIQGLTDLTHYFSELYSNVQSIDFRFEHSQSVDNVNYQRWLMTFRHPAIGRGKEISVRGCSELIWAEEKIIRHTDFFDAGSMLYEHLPVLGWAIRKLKERVQ
ncbi:MAG: transcriptional regulator [Oceanospirillaceae bacterium]|uniref:nuclear transport factor 2 family protein n=1 Tax=unclassified Thalassolituus TaxID=2624967 RepID=UPI000C0AC9C8|nr:MULTISPECIES: nuclear transport factor 2 family protein [unclassified Thalassolituus]MAK91552.1 transcriptional regulator [Thalassolituus sp.]MAS25271.1 transcriptional regulator [Oceanospirillaceae bacterium]MAX99069.1 transcriptional regulator [Oceanospirillaceae bacterium]MBL35391.1 transcriptional regulator [Oceanospirillaceae bacterium]MBS53336.1 transcriptional regulator [Oceanospirillaceae bacterium]|tara:strand:- start:88 stop:513 length:426 start_codon:yes stop_codon:yes gene_type:complete